jgi:hypothetical protein
VVIAGCNPPRRDEPSAAVPTGSGASAPRPLASAAPAPRASAASSASGAAPESSAPATGPNHPDPKTFACGKVRCASGKETCCAAGSEGACVASVGPGPNDKVQALASQIEQCSKTPHVTSLDRVARCDESADCAENETCCSQFLTSDTVSAFCLPRDKAGSAVCDFAELCIVGAGCRTPGAACVEGACQKPVKRLDCGKAACSGDKSACCGDPPDCRTPEGCGATIPRYRCAHPSDCLAGEHCQSSATGSYCARLVDSANAAVVCDTDADCPKESGFCRTMSCVAGPQLAIKICQCP